MSSSTANAPPSGHDPDLIARTLDGATARGELQLHYQPQLRLSDHGLAGFEVLSRWTSPVLGEVPPEVFIPIAEATGLLPEIGLWSIAQAIAEASAQPEQGFRIAVNVSATQLRYPEFVHNIAAILLRTGFPPTRLELEITERNCLLGATGAERCIADLRAMGLSVALDDFGAGQSNLVVLSRIEFDRLKLDQSLLADLPQCARAGQITAWVVSMAADLGLEVIAEGIETAAQDKFLWGIGCALGQGYLYAQALPIKAALAGITAPASVAKLNHSAT